MGKFGRKSWISVFTKLFIKLIWFINSTKYCETKSRKPNDYALISPNRDHIKNTKDSLERKLLPIKWNKKGTKIRAGLMTISSGLLP
jgi:hypothetical protein